MARPRDMLSEGSAWLQRQQRCFAAQRVRYSRNGMFPVTVPATIGRSEFDVVDEHSVMVRVQTRDYLIAADDFRISGDALNSISEPMPGDRILEWGVADDGRSCAVYVVMEPPGQP